MADEKKKKLSALIKRKEEKATEEKPSSGKLPKVKRKVKGFLMSIEHGRRYNMLREELAADGPELAEEMVDLFLIHHGKEPVVPRD